MSDKDIRERLPEMPVKDSPTWKSLKIEGLVKHPLELSPNELASLAQSGLTQTFECFDGWIAPNQRWSGVTVKDLLEMSGLMPDSQTVKFQSGSYSQELTIEEAISTDVIVALTLNGEPTPHGNGGPCRLVAGQRKGPAHVKWLQIINVTK